MADSSPPPDSTAGGPETAASATSAFTGLPQVAQIIGQFVAPATLLAGLLFYWGFFHARGFCAYFGVNSAVLGLSTTDYVMRSADGLFVPVAVVGAVVLALVWGWSILPGTIRRARIPGRFLWAFAVVALLLVANGLSRLLVDMTFNRGLGVAPLCFIVGVLILSVVVRVRRAQLHQLEGDRAAPDHALAPLEWGLLLLLVGGAFFWGATDYSLAVGTGRAAQVARNLPTAPSVVVFSEKGLGLDTEGVTTTRCGDPGTAYRYRYDGMVLVMSTDHNLVLVPRTWTPGSGPAVVLPRGGVGAVRYEYTGDTTVEPSSC